MIHLDTHVVVWLYAGDLKRLAPARSWIEHHELAISPMVKLELGYLREIGRLTRDAGEIVRDLVERIGLRVSGVAFPRQSKWRPRVSGPAILSTG